MKSRHNAFEKLLSLLTMAAVGTTAPLFADTPCAPNCMPQMSHHWAQLAYPDFKDVTIAANTSFGLSNYRIRDFYTTQQYLEGNFPTFTFGLSQTLLVYNWFYIQLREDASIGFAENADNNVVNLYLRRIYRSWFLDADAKLYIPFSISRENRLSLQPVLGFALHQAGIKGSRNVNVETETLSRMRFLAPLFGCALGYNPTSSFALRSSINVHMPRGKHRQPDSQSLSSYQSMRISRHGLSMDLLALMKLSPNWTLTAELEYMTYTLYGSDLGEGDPQLVNYSRISGKWGASYCF